MAEKLVELRKKGGGGNSSGFAPSYIGGTNKSSLPNTVSYSLGSGEHNLIIIGAGFNTNLTPVGTDTPLKITFNGNDVTLTLIGFIDESAKDLACAYCTVSGSGTLVAGIGGTGSNRNTSFMVFEI